MNDEIGELNMGHPSLTNSSSRYCLAQQLIGKGIGLNQASNSLRSGKWTVSPPTTITGPYNGALFLATGNVSDMNGTEGTIQFKADDEAVFTLDFRVPYSKSNQASIRCEGKDCNLYSYSVSRVPESGYAITPSYSITRK